MKLAFALLFLAGCNQLFGFDDDKLRVVDATPTPIDAPVDAMIDASPDANPDATLGCDPITQTGCAGGQKCTWITLDTTTNTGVAGCAPNGDAVLGSTCSRGADGPTTGYDTCFAGLYCANATLSESGLCEAFCTQSPDSCGANQRCSGASGILPDEQDYGICEFTCDPVTQQRTFDNADRCGSSDAINPEYGCYKPDADPGICMRVAAGAEGLDHGEVAFNWPGSVVLNGCDAGSAPLMRSSTDPSSSVICVAYCRPTETHSGNQSGAGGLPGSGYTCADRGAPGKECHYFWYLQPGPPVDNGIGYCWVPSNYLYDFDLNPGTPNTPHPACTALTNTDVDVDGTVDHLQYGCAPLP